MESLKQNNEISNGKNKLDRFLNNRKQVIINVFYKFFSPLLKMDKLKTNKIIIVDNNDNIIGYKNRDSIGQNDIYRVSALWLVNEKGEFLIAKRAMTKKNEPGKRGPAVAGTVEYGETYENNISKEAKEELGITIQIINKGPKKQMIGEDNSFFLQWYILETNLNAEDFIIQKEELDEVMWISEKRFFEEYSNNPDQYLEKMIIYVKQFGKQ